MSYTAIKPWLENQLTDIKKSGLHKKENIMFSAQNSQIITASGSTINFCANNYLGLACHPAVTKAAAKGMENYGFGMASVRFICGTQDIHKVLENRISEFLGTQDTILYTSCFDANTGLFETILGPEDVLISDALNHASIIDGVRLCRAQKKIYGHGDITDLEQKLKESSSARFRLIATDGVFSMQGDLARLKEICDLADQYDSLVMVDDSHATGFLGPNGGGTAEELGVQGRVDIITSTLGKALGGASGGFTSGRKEMIEFLRQRSRTYLFSNALAPPIVAGALKALDIVQKEPDLRKTLWDNTAYFRNGISKLGFDVVPSHHPIIAIMLGDEIKTTKMVNAINERGIFVVGFNFPVVPKGESRIRLQISAIHTKEQLDKALFVFREVGKNIGVI